MKTIIAGGRHKTLNPRDIGELNRFAEMLPISEVVSGSASGVDTEGEKWAESKGLPVTRFPAHWQTHGRGAGPIRNQKMADYADVLIAFSGGRGTQDMVKRAMKAGLKIIDLRGYND